MRFRLLFILFILCFLLPSVSRAEVRLPEPELETLPNGLEVAWFLNDSLPVTDLALVVRGGSVDDPDGKSGTAELLGNLLERASGGVSAAQGAREIELMGASRSVAVDDDSFTIGMHGLSSDASRLLEVLARTALRPDLAAEEVAREQARIQEEWSHVSDYAETLVSLVDRRALTAGTVYGRGALLSARELGTIGRAEVAAFHARHFRPAGSILVIVGRVDRVAFRAEVQRRFGDEWPAAPPSPAGAPPSRKSYRDPRLPPAGEGVIRLVDRPGLTQTQIRVSREAPAVTSPDHYALVVGNALLGDYFNSRLNLLIRDRLGLTYGISSALSYSLGFSAFSVVSSTRNEMTGQLLRKTLEVLKFEPVTEEEVRVAREYLVGGFPLNTAMLGAVASRWLIGRLHGLGKGYLNEFAPRVRAVTAAQVNRAMGRLLSPVGWRITVAGDARALAPYLKASGLAWVKVDPAALAK